MSHAFRRGDFCTDVFRGLRATRDATRAAINPERVIRPRFVIIRQRTDMPPRWRTPMPSVSVIDLSD